MGAQCANRLQCLLDYNNFAHELKLHEALHKSSAYRKQLCQLEEHRQIRQVLPDIPLAMRLLILLRPIEDAWQAVMDATTNKFRNAK